ncbi:MAG: hypothetical protein WAN65_30390 [Candidatus Sulfotelmatobacter sp.]
MNIDRKLNLVIPLTRDTGEIYVHSTPISRPTFEMFFKVIAQTYGAMMAQNYTAFSAPKIAALLLKDKAIEMRAWDGPNGVEAGLIAEIHRLTNIVMPGPNGWMTLPYQDAIQQNKLDDDELTEVENILVFFILVSAMVRRAEMEPMLSILSTLWAVQTTSSNCTEFARSLPTSTKAETSGEKATPSSMPY